MPSSSRRASASAAHPSEPQRYGTVPLSRCRPRTGRPGITSSTSTPSRTTNVSPDEHVRNPLGVPIRVVVRRTVDDPLRVEDRQVGITPDLHAPLATHHGRNRLEPPCRQQRHLAECVHQRERSFVPRVVPEDAGERPGPARVRPSLAERDAVARRDDVRLRDDPGIQLLGAAMPYYPASLAAVAGKRLGGQPLPRLHPLQGPVRGRRPSFPRVVQRRFDQRRARRIRVRLGRGRQFLARGRLARSPPLLPPPRRRCC